jgi:hypothetical protein
MSNLLIDSIASEPVLSLPFNVVNSLGALEIDNLHVLSGTCTGLPKALHGLLLASDLQGTIEDLLLGEALAKELETHLGDSSKNYGVILCGDLHAYRHKRGGSGDVRGVWNAFAKRFKWVVGVAGNHDVFGPGWSLKHLEIFKQQNGINLLDGDDNTVILDNLRFSGLSGVIGNPRKPFRRTREDYLEAVRKLDSQQPDLLILHEGPGLGSQNETEFPGDEELLENITSPLVCCGHKHWNTALLRLENGQQILNVDARVILLTNSNKELK